MLKNYRVKLSLYGIRCLEAGEKGRAEPYMEAYFFKLHGKTSSLSREGSQYNLSNIKPEVWALKSNIYDLPSMESGDYRDIPFDVGSVIADFEPIKVNGIPTETVAGLMGIIFVLSERDDGAVFLTGGDTIEAVIKKRVKDYFEYLIYKKYIIFSQGNLRDYFAAPVAQLIKYNQFYGGFSGADPDDILGYDVYLISHDDLAISPTGNKTFDLQTDSDGHWQIEGSFIADPSFKFLQHTLLSSPGQSPLLPDATCKRLQIIGNSYAESFPGVVRWWLLFHDLLWEIIPLIGNDREMTNKVAFVYKTIAMNAVDGTSIPLTEGCYDELYHLVLKWAALGNPRVSYHCRRLLCLLPKMKSRNLKEWVELFDANYSMRRFVFDINHDRILLGNDKD